MVTRLVGDLLSDRARRDGAGPLLTWYGLEPGERTELSAVSFANWVHKTSNLLLDELMVEPGDVVSLPLARAHPGHWVTFVWQLACWQTGLVVSLPEEGDGADGENGAEGENGAAVVVVGPEDADRPRGAGERVACSLHPLGLGFATPLPAGVLDYGLEVRAQPDDYLGAPPDASSSAWRDPRRSLAQAELVAVTGRSDRALVVASHPWPTTRDALLAPLVGGGSSVVVTAGVDPDRIARIRHEERTN